VRSLEAGGWRSEGSYHASEAHGMYPLGLVGPERKKWLPKEKEKMTHVCCGKKRALDIRVLPIEGQERRDGREGISFQVDIIWLFLSRPCFLSISIKRSPVYIQSFICRPRDTPLHVGGGLFPMSEVTL